MLEVVDESPVDMDSKDVPGEVVFVVEVVVVVVVDVVVVVVVDGDEVVV